MATIQLPSPKQLNFMKLYINDPKYKHIFKDIVDVNMISKHKAGQIIKKIIDFNNDLEPVENKLTKLINQYTQSLFFNTDILAIKLDMNSLNESNESGQLIGYAKMMVENGFDKFKAFDNAEEAFENFYLLFYNHFVNHNRMKQITTDTMRQLIMVLFINRILTNLK